MSDTCKNGHERTAANTTYRNGIRACLDCQRQQKGRAPMKRSSKRVKRLRGREARSSAATHQLSMSEAVRLVVVEFENVSAAARLSGRSRSGLAAEAWERVKRETRERDKNSCVRCRRRGHRLDVHHRLPKGIGGAGSKIAYGLANLVTLCRDCHSWAHANPTDALEVGLMVARHDEPEEQPIVLHGMRIWMDYQGERREKR